MNLSNSSHLKRRTNAYAIVREGGVNKISKSCQPLTSGKIYSKEIPRIKAHSKATSFPWQGKGPGNEVDAKGDVL